jgi:hypothetical protein
MSKYYIFLFYLLFPVNSFSNEKANSSGGNHPCLILQKTSVPAVREGIKKYPPLTASFEEAKKFADEAIKAGIKVPVPKDPLVVILIFNIFTTTKPCSVQVRFIS